MLDNINNLLERIRKTRDLRDRVRSTTMDLDCINYDLSQYVRSPWADFFVDNDAVLRILDVLCPGWVYLGEWDIGSQWTVWIGHVVTGEIKESLRVSDPSTLSLLTLILETHYEILGSLLEKIQKE